MHSVRYVAFLRGINSGKNPPLKMDVLKKAFEDLGYENVRTVIASGNVIFDAPTDVVNLDPVVLEQEIEFALPKVIDFKTEAFVCTLSDLQDLINKNPFQDIDLTAQKKAYVTFIKHGARVPLKFPYTGDGFILLENFHSMVCSIVDFSTSNSPSLMKVLDKELGKGNTTRGWSTIAKIVGV